MKLTSTVQYTHQGMYMLVTYGCGRQDVTISQSVGVPVDWFISWRNSWRDKCIFYGGWPGGYLIITTVGVRTVAETPYHNALRGSACVCAPHSAALFSRGRGHDSPLTTCSCNLRRNTQQSRQTPTPSTDVTEYQVIQCQREVQVELQSNLKVTCEITSCVHHPQ